ncbi:MAG: MvdC family ATP-grasp ribosomal peptide maturase [Deltaproteobacteria bacterium]|nr:MvdC family ATP-grasp ribosomal peptide maturase [Deltaproteobacteria bacterium]
MAEDIATRSLVLLVTHRRDEFVTGRVAAELELRGAAPFRLNTDEMPDELRIVSTFLHRRLEQRLVSEGRSIRLDDVRAIWWRRVAAPTLPPNLDPRFRVVCQASLRKALSDALDALDRVNVVNPRPAEARAESKLRQLQCAAELGLRVPETIVTNDPTAARSFLVSHPRSITKLLVPFSQSLDGRGPTVPTSEIRPSDLNELDPLILAPQIFQPQISKSRELRVVVVGKKAFAASIDASESEHGKVDWGQSAPGEVAWREERLPSAFEQMVVRLVERLGLVFGALDFIVDVRGEYHFLEINPSGEWGWLERDLGLPIAAAIAEALLEGV